MESAKNILIGVILILFAWVFIFYIHIFSELLLPEPFITLKHAFALLLGGGIFKDFFPTVFRWLFGFSFGMLLGVPFGLMIGSWKKLYGVFDFPLDFFRSLPVTALFPLFLLLFGVGDKSKIAMVFAATFPIIAMDTYYGVAHSSKKRNSMAISFGASKLDIFKKITFWEALPNIFAGGRLSISASLIVVIISEMFIGTQYGLGQRLFDAYATSRTIELFSLLIIVGMIGYAANKISVIIEERVLVWKSKT